MADKFLKTLKLPGIDEPYKIPQTAEDVGAVSIEDFLLGMDSKVNDLVTVEGTEIIANNSTIAPIYEFKVYGKTTQSGTPTPTTPIPLVSPGYSNGQIIVKIGDFLNDTNATSSIIKLPNGLPGIPVADNGNYMDSSGQQWVCDEVDFSTEKYIQRIGIYTTDENTNWSKNGGDSKYIGTNNIHLFFSISAAKELLPISKTLKGCLCDQFKYYESTGTGNDSVLNTFKNFPNQYNVAFDVDKNIADSLEAWKTYVAQNPLTVYYILETPIESKLTLSALNNYVPPTTREETTAVWNNDDMFMSLKYCAPSTPLQVNELATLGRRATLISDNSDLNDFTEVGTYFCNATTAKTLTNCPDGVDVGFKLYVGASTPTKGYYFQAVQTYQNDIYIRFTASENSNDKIKWYAWQQFYSTRTQISTESGGVSADITEDYGVTEHLYRCELFMNQANKKARRLGLKNSIFKTPSGLNTEPKEGSNNDTSYNSKTTPYDLIRLLIAVRNTPSVLSAMSTRGYYYFKSGERIAETNIILGSSAWKDWEAQTGFEILAGKGGSLGGVQGELDNNSNGILNQAMLIKANNKTYAIAIMGFDSVNDWKEGNTYAKGKKVQYKRDGVTYHYISKQDNNDKIPTDTDAWTEVSAEGTIIREIMEEMISMIENSISEPVVGGAIDTIKEARDYVGLGIVRLSDSGKYGDDIYYLDNSAAESSRFFYNGDKQHVAASTTKILTALTIAPYLTNQFCTISNNDLVGGSGASFSRGDVISSADALNLMMGRSDNTMATMLARVYAKKVQETGLGEYSYKNKYTSYRTTKELDDLMGNCFWAYNGGSVPLMEGLAASTYAYGIHYQYSPKNATQVGYCVYTGDIIKRYKSDTTGEWGPWERFIDAIGAAPAINIGSYVGDLDSLDIPLNSVAWIAAGSCTNCPTGNYAYLETWGNSYGGRFQRITTITGPAAQRCRANGAWTEWEWINPPLTYGVEYRTTERLNAKPVYVKAINFGAWPAANSYIQVDFNTSDKTLIDIQTTGYAEGNGYSTINYPATTVQAYTNIIRLTNNNSFTLAGIRGCFVVKYVYN